MILYIHKEQITNIGGVQNMNKNKKLNTYTLYKEVDDIIQKMYGYYPKDYPQGKRQEIINKLYEVRDTLEDLLREGIEG